jgi:hypothetical protein
MTVFNFNDPQVRIEFFPPCQKGQHIILHCRERQFRDETPVTKVIVSRTWCRPKEMEPAIKPIDNYENGARFFRPPVCDSAKFAFTTTSSKKCLNPDF